MYKNRIDKIREIISNKKMTQKQFAKAIGYTQESISRFLNGKSRITEGFLQSVNKAFPEYSMYELMCFIDETILSDGICKNINCKWYRPEWRNGCLMLNSIKSCKDKVM